MKKLLFVFSIVFVLVSCDDGNMNNEDADKESKQGYLTITYHSEGHTEGEVPVDDTRYPIVATGYTVEKDFAAPYRAAVTIFGPGTLKKHWSSFVGWEVKDAGNLRIGPSDIQMYSSDFSFSGFFSLLDADSKQIELHAVWKDF